MNISPLQKSISRVFPNRTAATIAEVMLLLVLGMIAMTLHSKLRIPMHLPGKQGILFVALIVSSRGLSRMPFASSLTCLGSSLFLLTGIPGAHDPFMAVNYILLGGVMDLIYGYASRISEKPWILAVASGIAWMFMPLFKLIMSLFFIVPVNSFSTGILYPFATHLLFGITGGLIGAGILSLLKPGK